MSISIKSSGNLTINQTGSLSVKAELFTPRPMIDSYHLHAYACYDAPGSTVLEDAGTAAKNLTLSGGEGTAYSLRASVPGDSNKYVRSLLDNSSFPFASNNTINHTLGEMTIEFVVAWSSLATGAVNRNLLTFRNSADTQSIWVKTYEGKPHGGVWWQVNGFTPNAYNQSVMATPPSLNTPYHIMYTYINSGDGWQSSKLWVNGTYIGGTAINMALGNLWNMSNLILGGTNSISGNSSACYMRDIRISSIARNTAYAAASAAALLA